MKVGKRLKPIAVIISDVHYNLKTLEVADAAVRQAIAKANDLQVPLIVAGDLHDTKANMRAECVNQMISTFLLTKTDVLLLRGNHCSLNQRSSESALKFLSPYVYLIVDHTEEYGTFYLIPYQDNVNELRAYLKTLPKGATLIMHQGIQGSASGEYIQDHSALSPEDVAGFRVISGHYHQRQTIQLPDGGQWDYIGNPYTLGFGEANDPEKGFQVLYSDGSLEFIPTNLRKHVVVDYRLTDIKLLANLPHAAVSEDLLWVKLRGPGPRLDVWDKKSIAQKLNFYGDFRLDLIPDEVTATETSRQLPQPEMLDSVIDSASVPDDQKLRLKKLWKGLV